MSAYPIPPASLARLQAAYAQFEQLANVVAEAMGIDTSGHFRLDLPGKQFIVEDEAASTLSAVPDGLASG